MDNGDTILVSVQVLVNTSIALNRCAVKSLCMPNLFNCTLLKNGLVGKCLSFFY